MKIHLISCLALLPLLQQVSCSKGSNNCDPVHLKITQTVTPLAAIDTRGGDQYIAIAKKLLLNIEPSSAEWDALFETPYYDLLIKQNKASTAAKEKEDMRIAYLPSRAAELANNASRLEQHLSYKSSLTSLESYIAFIKNSAVIDSTKSFLYPYIPIELRNPALFPGMIYTYYYAKEANGIPSGIVQDLSLVAMVDGYRLGLLSAHEAYHAITTKAFEGKLNPQVTCVDVRTQMLDRLINPIAQEGIADLIDKDILLQPGSPVRDILLSNFTNETNLALTMITKLDEELKFAKQNGKFKTAIDQLNNNLIKNAGHIPGRVMAKAIQQYGQLPALLPVIHNPFKFFYSYNEAAKLSGGALPVFSTESIEYLKQIEAYLILS